jgi:hypothetical protein
MRVIVTVSALLLAVACGRVPSTNPPFPPTEGEGEVGEGEGEVGEGEGEAGEGEGEAAEGEGEAGEGEGEGEGEPVPFPEGSGTLALQLVDTEGASVAGASVVLRINDQVVSGSTDDTGGYRADLRFGVVEVEITHPDYTPLRRSFAHANTTAETFLPLRVKTATVATFSSVEGGTVDLDGALVTFPAGGYVSKATGEPAVGTLEVRAAYFDGTNPAELEASPPLYRVVDDPTTQLVTFGMMNVELFIAGEPVDLGPGMVAQLDTPLDQYVESLATMRTIDPDFQTIPTWWWDEQAAGWVEEGRGQIVEVEGGLRFRGSVPHFTWWNIDGAFTWGGGCPSIACGTNTGRCSAGTLRCFYDGHFFRLHDGQCNTDRNGNCRSFGCCQPYECVGEVGPTGESCNGEDDNCNGQTDEGFGVGNGCSVGVGQCRRNGTVICSGGGSTCNASPGSPSAEVCNNLDDDCDGTPDDGIGKGDACAVGVGACRRTGTRVCAADGSVVCSATPGQPSPETCNDIDDDCDGEVDDNIGKGDVCVETASAGEKDALDTNDDGRVSGAEFDGRAPGLGVCARRGVNICSPDETVVCSVSAAAPRTETCDSTDEDCDGVIDDDPSMLIEDQDPNDRIPMPTIRGQEGETSGTAFAATCDCTLRCENGVDQCIEVEAGVEYDLADPDTAAARGCVERVQG